MNFELSINIGNFLIDKQIKNTGLFHGNAGIAIFYYNLAKRTLNQNYQKHANLLIEEIYKTFNNDTNLEDGIAGIGWCIEYLIQYKLCKGNTNEILKDIDARIFNLLNESNDIQFNLQKGIIGYLQYILMRLKNKKDYKNAKTQILIELLKHIINKIDLVAPLHFIDITKDIRFNLLDNTYVLLWSFFEAFKLNIYNDKIINMLKQWETYLLSYIPSLNINRLYMATILLQINKLLKSEKISKHINVLLYSIDINSLRIEIDLQKVNNIQLGYLGFLFVLQMSIIIFDSTFPNYKELIDFKRNITALNKNKLFDELYKEEKVPDKYIFDRQYGLAEGWAGVGLLLLLFPNILE